MANLGWFDEMRLVLEEVSDERVAQDQKWGEQNHPNGTCASLYTGMADSWKKMWDKGNYTWNTILSEEFFESQAEEGDEALRKELIQVAAVAVAWIECIDRRKTT